MAASQRKWSREELQTLREWYWARPSGNKLELDKLALALGRHKTNVCRKARQLGLSNQRRTTGGRKSRRKYRTAEEASSMDDIPLRLMAGRDAAIEFARTVGCDDGDREKEIIKIDASTPITVYVYRFEMGRLTEALLVKAFDDDDEPASTEQLSESK